MKKKILMVGVGNIGFRLTQALQQVAVDGGFHIDLVGIERSEQASSRAKKELNGVVTEDRFSLAFEDYQSIAGRHFDLAIVSTDSKNRLSALRSVLESCTVDCVLLEKFLYPKAADYREAQSLLDTNNTQAWVNCARNVWPSYLEIKKVLPEQPIGIRVSGTNWGLGCNGIHFLSLAEFLTQSPVEVLAWPDEDQVRVHDAKRDGYRELTGTLAGKTASGCDIELISKPDGSEPLSVEIEAGNTTIRVREADGVQIWKSGSQTRELPFSITHTSQLSGALGDVLSERQTTYPDHRQSARLHLLAIEAMNLIFYGIADAELECPVT